MRSIAPVKPLIGVRVRLYVAEAPLVTVADAELEPAAVRVNDPVRKPLPVRGTPTGEVGSELVMLSVPERRPDAVGVKVSVIGQLAPGASVGRAQVWEMA